MWDDALAYNFQKYSNVVEKDLNAKFLIGISVMRFQWNPSRIHSYPPRTLKEVVILFESRFLAE